MELKGARLFHPRRFKDQMKLPPLKPFRVSTVTPHQSLLDRGQGQGAGEDFKDLRFFFFFQSSIIPLRRKHSPSFCRGLTTIIKN